MDHLVAALGQEREPSVMDLRKAAADATAKQDWKLKTRLATVALYLNDTTIAAEMLQAEPPSPKNEQASDSKPIDDSLAIVDQSVRPLLEAGLAQLSKAAARIGIPVTGSLRKWDPIQRTQFIEHFPSWSGSVEKLVGVLQKDGNESLRSGFCLALGGLANPSAEAKKDWEPVLGDWYRDQPDKGVHGATKWALQSWALTMPNLDTETPPPAGREWRVTKKGLTLIRIPAGEVQGEKDQGGQDRGKPIRIANEFWLSDCEVTAGLFAEFLRDPNAEKPLPGGLLYGEAGAGAEDSSLPVVNVSWYDAVLFCNWLSHQEGLQPCYAKEGKEKIEDYDGKTREYDAWKLIEGANGYRLPTEDQWEYACRARTTTAFAFGDDEDLLDRYAVYVKNAKGGPSAVGGKLCNAWGVFDMHGNVWEWCWDGYREGSIRVIWGGSWDRSSTNCRSAYRNWPQPDARDDGIGFRVASVPSSQ